MLTATHATAIAWGGLGSAFLRVWKQVMMGGLTMGVSSAFLYLGNILVLHITTPALLSLQTFKASRVHPVTTNSLPVFDFGDYNMSHDKERKAARLEA
jgi:hypothetical protein